MKEQLLDLVRGADGVTVALNRAREYLQARILLALQDAGAMIPLAFQGGTALRFLYGLPRFSEDLDFTLERPERMDLDFLAVGNRFVKDLGRDGYEAGVTHQTGTAVHRLMVGFPGLLYELGLSPHVDQTLKVRIEVDTNPPPGAGLKTTVVRRHLFLNLQHHDRPSLLAGKLHAVLQRPWAKGRDLFDLFWYLSDRDWPAPNLLLLNNALAQSGWDGPTPSEDSWRSIVANRVRSLDWKAAEQDVSPFLEPGAAADAFGMEPLLGLLSGT